MRVRIINLGEIVTLNIMKTIGAFITVIASKNPTSNPADIGQAIGSVLQANMSLINDFKLGIIDENDFNEKMISALEKATEVKLSIAEFDSAWSAMHPSFTQFEALLNEVIAFNTQPRQKVILISFTNTKDIRYLIDELLSHGIACKTDGDQLTEIAGIKLLTTYAAQKSKAELIEIAINELRLNPVAQGTFASSMGALFSVDQYKPLESHDIKYIRAVNDIKDPVLKDDLDKTIQEVEKQATSLAIEIIIWKKFEKQSLSDVLNSTPNTSRMLPASML